MKRSFKICTVLVALYLMGCAGQKTTGSLQIKLGACDWTLGMSADPTVFAFAKQIGLDGVQVSIAVENGSLPLLDPALQKKLLDASKATGVAIASFAIGQLNDIPYKSDPAAEKYLDQSVDIAASMGVPIILVPFFGKGDLRNDPEGTEIVIERLKKLAPKAEKLGVILAIESWLSAEDHMKIIRAVGSTAVKVYYDVGNSDKAGYDIFREIRSLGKTICEFHAKDYADLYGKGSIDFAAVRNAMQDIGFNGWLVMEGVQLPLGIEESMKADLNYLQSIFPFASE